MGAAVFVKVVGFRDVERHALNTVFRLSAERQPCYALWTPQAPVMPHVALIDTESYEAGLALASPGLNRNLKLICVGKGAPANAWRVFSRPIEWSAVLQAMDELFAHASVNIDLVPQVEGNAAKPPGVRASLLVDPSRDERLYLRARFALAGLIEVDEVDSVSQAALKVCERPYDVVVVDVDAPGDVWGLVERLVAHDPPIGSVLVTTINTSWRMHERAELAGCRAVLNKPYDPGHVFRVLQMV